MRPRSPATELKTHNVPPPRGEEPAPRFLAELNGVGEVGGEQIAAQRGVHLELLLRGKEPGGDDDGVEAVQGLRWPDRAPGRMSPAAAGRRARRSTLPLAGDDLEVVRAARQLFRVAAEQEQPVAALRHGARQRAAHAARGAEEHDLHG